MAHRPAFLQDGMPEADVWQEIERLGQEQGVDSFLAPVGIQAPNSAFREAITNLVAVQGAAITEEKPDEKLLWVKLSYEGQPGIGLTRDKADRATGKPSICQKI